MERDILFCAGVEGGALKLSRCREASEQPWWYLVETGRIADEPFGSGWIDDNHGPFAALEDAWGIIAEAPWPAFLPKWVHPEIAPFVHARYVERSKPLDGVLRRQQRRYAARWMALMGTQSAG